MLLKGGGIREELNGDMQGRYLTLDGEDRLYTGNEMKRGKTSGGFGGGTINP